MKLEPDTVPGTAAAPARPPAMRVLHLSSLYPPQAFGGAEKVVEVLAEGGAARGLSVSVAHQVREPLPPSHRHGVDVRPLAHRNPLWIEDAARYPGPVRHLNKVATLFNVLTAADFGRVLDSVRPDLVHSHSMSDLTPLMWQRAGERGIAVVHTLHDYDLLCIRGTLYKDGRHCTPRHASCALFSRLKRVHHRHVSQVVGVSRSILQTHVEHGFFDHLPDHARSVIWNPLRGAKLAAARPARDPARPLTFGFLGRLVPEKGIGLLLQACRRLPAVGWQLRVGGRAPAGMDALVGAAAGLPVDFAGFVDPAAFLATIDVLVVPSLWLEPFGLTIFEAYLAGVRVLGSNIAGVAEIVGAVDPAALFAAGDAGALADKMASVLSGAQGLALPAPPLQAALARIDPDVAVGRYLEVYASAINSRAARRSAPPVSP